MAKVAVLATSLIAAEALSPGQFGRYASLYALTFFAAAVWDFGVSTLLTRETAAGRLTPRQALLEALTLRLKAAPVLIITHAAGLLLIGSALPIGIVATIAFCLTSVASGLNAILLAGLRGGLRFGHASFALAPGRWVSAIAQRCPPLGLAESGPKSDHAAARRHRLTAMAAPPPMTPTDLTCEVCGSHDHLLVFTGGEDRFGLGGSFEVNRCAACGICRIPKRTCVRHGASSAPAAGSSYSFQTAGASSGPPSAPDG